MRVASKIAMGKAQNDSAKVLLLAPLLAVFLWMRIVILLLVGNH